jgi:hypothetical protein
MNTCPRLISSLAALLLAACASTGGPSPAPSQPATITTAARPVDDPARITTILAAAEGRERDRAAILALLGEYAVRFDFHETVALKAGYERHPEKTSGAHEVVVLVEDTGDRLVLQHLLVVGDGHVIKHWRQDWHFEARERLRFSEDQTWRLEPLPEAKIADHWTQCVFEVSDAPRYCGTGKWNHRYGVSTWTSDRSWRPLPRREYTTRSDYNALNVENRHTITPSGWTHEQDNTKVRREGERTAETLVREFGFNDYRRVDGFDFSPAYAYWAQTADYWAGVRAEWDRRIARDRGIRLLTPVDGMALITPLFAQAQRVQDGETVAADELLTVFEAHTAAPSGSTLAGHEPARADSSLRR